MCGLAGVLDRSRTTSSDALNEAVSAMADVLGHRGPDDHGTWVDASAGIAFGHRRLAVIDLSEDRAAQQQMEQALKHARPLPAGER